MDSASQASAASDSLSKVAMSPIDYSFVVELAPVGPGKTAIKDESGGQEAIRRGGEDINRSREKESGRLDVDQLQTLIAELSIGIT